MTQTPTPGELCEYARSASGDDWLETALLADIDDCLDAGVVCAWHLEGRLGLPTRSIARSNGPSPPVRVCIDRVRRNASRGRDPSPISMCYSVFDATDPPTDPMAMVCMAKLVRRRQARSATLAPTPGSLPAAPGATIALRVSDLLIWHWPDDPALPQLRSLLDGSAARFLCDRPVIGVDTLKWEPQRRATLRFRFQGEDGATDDVRFAKTFARSTTDIQGAAIDRRFVHFWRQAIDRVDAPLVPRPLGFDPATSTVWQAQARGAPLLDTLRQTGKPSHARHDATGALARAVAEAIAAIHRAPTTLAGTEPDNPTRDAGHWKREIGRRQRKLSRARSSFAAAAERLADGLVQALNRDLDGAFGGPRLIHGDCHPEQLWVDDDRIVWFDFDEFCLGEPMEDLAQFVTKLDPPHHAIGFAEAVIDAYALALSDAFDRRRLAWQRALQHLLQASRAFVFQRPDWPLQVQTQLDEGIRHLRIWEAS